MVSHVGATAYLQCDLCFNRSQYLKHCDWDQVFQTAWRSSGREEQEMCDQTLAHCPGTSHRCLHVYSVLLGAHRIKTNIS